MNYTNEIEIHKMAKHIMNISYKRRSNLEYQYKAQEEALSLLIKYSEIGSSKIGETAHKVIELIESINDIEKFNSLFREETDLREEYKRSHFYFIYIEYIRSINDSIALGKIYEQAKTESEWRAAFFFETLGNLKKMIKRIDKESIGEKLEIYKNIEELLVLLDYINIKELDTSLIKNHINTFDKGVNICDKETVTRIKHYKNIFIKELKERKA